MKKRFKCWRKRDVSSKRNPQTLTYPGQLWEVQVAIEIMNKSWKKFSKRKDFLKPLALNRPWKNSKKTLSNTGWKDI